MLRGNDQESSYYKWRLNFLSYVILIPLHSFPSEPGKRENKGGICSGQILTHARVKTRVPHHQNLPMTLARKTIRVIPQRAASRTFSRPFPPPEGIDYPEGVHSPKISSSALSKTSVTNSINSHLHLWSLLPSRSSHISNMVYDLHFNVSSYRK